MKKKIKLDAYERAIERNIHKFKPAENQEELRKGLIEAAKEYVAARDLKSNLDNKKPRI